MGLIIADEKLQKAIARFFEKLEEYYPEHKVFALDSIDKHLQEDLSSLYKQSGCVSADEFLATHGFQRISGEEVKAIRSCVLYTPGNEPAAIKDKVDNMVRQLDEYYPYRKIPRELSEEHPRLAKTISGLYQWLGYPNSNAMLVEYGFDVPFLYSRSGRPRKNPQEIQEIIALLQEKYKDNQAKSFDSLYNENPEYAATLKTLQNKSNQLFGTSIAKHFKKLGILRPALSEREASVEPEKKKTYNYFTFFIEEKNYSAHCITKAKTLEKGIYVEAYEANTNERVVGVITDIFYAVEDLPCPVEEMYRFDRRLSSNRVKKKKDPTIRKSCFFPEGYLYCAVKLSGRSDSLYYKCPFYNIEVGDLVKVYHFWYGWTKGVVTKTMFVTEGDAPYPPNKTRIIREIIRSANQEKEELLNAVSSLAQKHTTRPFFSPVAEPAIEAKYTAITHFSSAVFRGLDADVSAALQILYPSELDSFSKRETLCEGISQFECCSEHVPKILEAYPNMKAIFFAEDWKSDTVYLGFSDSGYSTVSSLRLIGNCDFYTRDRWSIIHDPTEKHFSFDTGEYDFIEKDKWEALDYVLPSGKEQLASQDIIPSRPYKKLTSCDPCEIIKIEYPINEVFYQKPPEAEKKELPQPPLGTSSLAGKIFVVTGDLYNYSSREELKKIIEAMGGKLTGSVSSKTTALITNEPYSGTTKIRKAHECGIEIISEDEFIKRYMANPSDKEHSLNEAEEIIVDDDGLIYLDDDEEYEGYPRMEDRIAAYYLYSDDPEKGGRLLEVAYTNAVLEELFEKYNYRKSEKLEGDYTNEFTLYDIIPRPQYAGVQTLEEFTTTLLSVLVVFGEANSGFEEELASRKDEIAKAFTAIEGTSLESLLDEDDFVVDGYAFELKNNVYKARYRQCRGGW